MLFWHTFFINSSVKIGENREKNKFFIRRLSDIKVIFPREKIVLLQKDQAKLELQRNLKL